VHTRFCLSGRPKPSEVGIGDSPTLLPDGHSIRFYRSVKEVLGRNDQLFGRCSPFLDPAYLQAVEQAPPAQFAFLYGVVHRGEEPIAALFFQVKPLSVEQSLQDATAKRRSIKDYLKKLLSFNVLVCGSLLNSGELGLACKAPFRDEVLPACLHAARAYLAERGTPTTLVLVKDFYAGSRERFGPILTGAGFHELAAQPAMWMELHASWRTFEDYQEALHSKYRVRVKRAFKKAAEIQRTELSLEEITQHKETLFVLYREVAKGAGFNTFELSEEYFTSLKKQMPDRFKVFGYWLNGELIAFYTALLDEHQLEAHFLGLRQDLNAPYQLYLNILFDLVKIGIYHHCPKINFARTALEIKSSVGAEPQALYFYLWSANPILQLLIPRLYRLFNPDEPWQPRHPFKSDD
jgi:hypothetical protein